MKINYRALLLIGVALLTACGSSAASYNNEGNEAFEAERFSEALDNYTSAKQEDSSLPEPYYNSGNALHRQGDLEAALLQLQESLRAGDDQLSQYSFYNLGNTYFKQEDWTSAIDAYVQALILDPDDEDAKYNLELALQNLRQQQQQQQQSSQQPQSGQSGQQQQQNEGEEPSDQEQEQNGGQNEENEGGGDGEQEQEDQSGQGDQQDQQEQPSQGELSPEEAEQLLDALGQDSETLQERLQQQFGGTAPPPDQDW